MLPRRRARTPARGLLRQPGHRRSAPRPYGSPPRITKRRSARSRRAGGRATTELEAATRSGSVPRTRAAQWRVEFLEKAASLARRIYHARIGREPEAAAAPASGPESRLPAAGAGVAQVPAPERVVAHAVIDTRTGERFTGSSHADAIRHAAPMQGPGGRSEPRGFEIGFVTSGGRFVTPQQARDLASLSSGREEPVAPEPRFGRSAPPSGAATSGQEATRSFGSADAARALARAVVEAAGPRATILTDDGHVLWDAAAREQFLGRADAATRVAAAQVDIVGQRMATPEDVHRVVAPFRNPLAERLLVAVVSAEHQVLEWTLWSSGVPDFVLMNVDALASHIAQLVHRTGAAYPLIAHNHPSGDPTPSGLDEAGRISTKPEDYGDLHFTRDLDEALQRRGIQLRGHYIIDHESGTMIHPDGRHEPVTFAPDILPPDVDWTLQDPPDLSSPQAAVAALSAALQPGHVHVLYRGVRGQATGLQVVEPAALLSADDWLPRRMRGVAAPEALLVVDRSAHYQAIVELVNRERGRLAGVLDVIEVRHGRFVQSARTQGALIEAPAVAPAFARRLREQGFTWR